MKLELVSNELDAVNYAINLLENAKNSKLHNESVHASLCIYKKLSAMQL